MIFVLTIATSFFLFYMAINIHRKYITATEYYNQKLISIRESTLELERGREELFSITRQFREEKSSIRVTCAKDPNVDCTLCDKECLFRRKDIDD